MAMEDPSKNILLKLSKSLLRKALVIWAGLLTFFHLDKSFNEVFPNKVWKAEKKSTQEGWTKVWGFLFGIPIFIFVVIFLEEVFLEEVLRSQSFELNTQTKGICPKTLGLSIFYCLVTKSELLKLFETFAIISAFFIYIFDKKERKEQAMREDWSLIDGARGSQTSGARYSAITRLHLERESLRGLDAESADLRKIDLEEADLENANLQKVDLRESILARAILNGANLSEANLEGADCREISLWQADLRNANLRKVNFKGAWIGAGKLHRANLRGANLYESDLRGARFYQTNLRGADLRKSLLQEATFKDIDFAQVEIEDADIQGTRFIRPLNLTVQKIKTTENWHEAFFSVDFAPADLRFRRDEEPKPWHNVNDGDASAELLNLTNEIHEIEDLLEKIRGRKNYSLNDLKSHPDETSLELPEFSTLREMLLHLEDLSDSKLRDIEILIDDLNNQLTKTTRTDQKSSGTNFSELLPNGEQ
jgi:uncharacterized protein YjbI with pentapeptide repeats